MPELESVSTVCLSFDMEVGKAFGLCYQYKARRTAAVVDPKVKLEDGVSSAPGSPTAMKSMPTPPLSSIMGYFTVPKELHRAVPSTLSVSNVSSSATNKKRGADDVVSPVGVRTAKSARSEATVFQGEVEPGWTGPYGL